MNTIELLKKHKLYRQMKKYIRQYDNHHITQIAEKFAQQFNRDVVWAAEKLSNRFQMKRRIRFMWKLILHPRVIGLRRKKLLDGQMLTDAENQFIIKVLSPR
jgi:hypothetical protein